MWRRWPVGPRESKGYTSALRDDSGVPSRVGGRWTTCGGCSVPWERKNGWQLAEQAGDATPYGVQHLLSTYVWDADLVRDDLRDYVVEHLGDVHGVLVVDETGFLKKGNKSVGVQRQYSGTAGRIENCQIGVFLTYASAEGRTLLDRELYLPRVWVDDLERRREAGVPEKVAFRTKPQLARRMLERALESGVPFGWVTGDEVYGNDRRLRLWLERGDVPHVLAVRSNEKLWAETDRGWRQVRADRLAPGVEEPGWVRRSAGDGAKGPRVYDWARVEIRPLKEPGKGYWLLVRRSIAKPGELAYYVCFGPESTTLEELVRVAGTRWTIEECFEEAKGEVGLDQYEVPEMGWLVPAHHPGDAGPRLPGGGQATGVGTRRSGRKGGLSQLGRKADTPDGARGPAVALPADMETSTYGRISAVVVPVETAAPGNGPALPLPTPPETPHHISATVVLGRICAVYAQEAAFKGRTNVSEREFQEKVVHDLRMSSPTSEVQEHSQQAGGITDIRFRGVIVELKVEDENGERSYLAQKYSAQVTQYAGVEARQVSILLILDLTEKANPPGDIKNDIFLSDVPTHGASAVPQEFPSKVFLFVVNGNTRNPSSYSR